MTEQVQGELEDPKATIKRIMSLADPNTVIPYPVLPDLYHDKAQMRLKRGECQCGCGQRAALAKTSWLFVTFGDSGSRKQNCHERGEGGELENPC
jgi:hypothetical protein